MIHYKNADKEARARIGANGKGQPESVEAKATQLCADKTGEAKVLCIYEKLGGAYEGSLEEIGEDDEKTTEEEPKKRGPKPKVK